MPEIQMLAELANADGYNPSVAVGGNPNANTLYRSNNMWFRPGGQMKTKDGLSQISSTSISPRIFAVDDDRGQIAGDYVSTKLPKQGLLRYQLGAYFFFSEETSKQLYINETAITGATTSSTARKLRVAIPAGGGTYTTYDAGLLAPTLPSGNVAEEANGGKSMAGVVSVVVAARAFGTDSTSNPSNAIVKTLTAAGNNRIRITIHSLTTVGSQQDGWLLAGTEWNRGNTGPWKELRDVRTTVRGTITYTNGSGSVTGASSYFTQDLRNGDRIRANSTDYYVSITSDTALSLYSDAALTTPTTFGGSTTTYTTTVREAVMDWRDKELGDVLDFSNSVPPLLDGIFLFNNILWGWSGNSLYASKAGNPEAWPQTLSTFAQTQSGADIIQALAGNAQIYLLTKNGLEIVTFTQREDAPFLVKKVWDFSFFQPNNAVVADGQLYALVGSENGVMAIRTETDDFPDIRFGRHIESDLENWSLDNSVVTVDPTNKAVLFCHYNSGADTTTVIPFMLQTESERGGWSGPITESGRLTDGAQIGGRCVMPVKTSTNYRANYFEGGNGSSTTGYCVWPFVGHNSLRSVIKRIQAIGRMSSVSVFVAKTATAIPDVTDIANAVATFTQSDTYYLEGEIKTHIKDARLFAIRADFSGASRGTTRVIVRGYVNGIPQ